MSTKCLSAWTPSRERPPYVNFSVENGEIVMFARGEPGEGRVYGYDISVRMSIKEFCELIGTAVSELVLLANKQEAQHG